MDGFLLPGFHWNYYFSKALNSKKEKLTDIGFLLVFPGLKELVSFQWIWISRLMFVEHQSTSNANIQSCGRVCKSIIAYSFAYCNYW